jgi:hypothetical protein
MDARAKGDSEAKLHLSLPLRSAWIRRVGPKRGTLLWLTEERQAAAGWYTGLKTPQAGRVIANDDGATGDNMDGNTTAITDADAVKSIAPITAKILEQTVAVCRRGLRPSTIEWMYLRGFRLDSRSR